MADDIKSPNVQTADEEGSIESPSQEDATQFAKPDFFAQVAMLFQRPKKTGAHCEYCDWSGPNADVLKAPRMNEDGKQYMINTCPNCMRNGGLVFYD